MKRRVLDEEDRLTLEKLMRNLKRVKALTEKLLKRCDSSKAEELKKQDARALCEHEFTRRHYEGMRDNGEYWSECLQCGHRE
jgi:hypothetical protein